MNLRVSDAGWKTRSGFGGGVGERSWLGELGPPRSRISEDELNLIMPVLSKFYGIVIRMIFSHPYEAHFHAFYDQSELVVAISPLNVIQGDAPQRVRRMVLEWAANHQRELQEAWKQCQQARTPEPIAPLW